MVLSKPLGELEPKMTFLSQISVEFTKQLLQVSS